MMMTNHPITPPSEVLDEWLMDPALINWQAIAIQSAQWGADQELEACCAWVDYHCSKDASLDLSADRRPKPPTLKEQALAVLDDCANCLDGAHENTIRRALEALDD
jgi:hypothetical protein